MKKVKIALLLLALTLSVNIAYAQEVNFQSQRQAIFDYFQLNPDLTEDQKRQYYHEQMQANGFNNSKQHRPHNGNIQYNNQMPPYQMQGMNSNNQFNQNNGMKPNKRYMFKQMKANGVDPKEFRQNMKSYFDANPNLTREEKKQYMREQLQAMGINPQNKPNRDGKRRKREYNQQMNPPGFYRNQQF